MKVGILLVGGACLIGFSHYAGWNQQENAIDPLADTPGTSEYHDEWHRVLATSTELADFAALKETIDEKFYDCFDPELNDEFCVGYGRKACKQLQGNNLGFLVFVVMGLLYLFVGIAIVCDDLFVPGLEIVAEELELSDDVAGATLMAAGGSAPELATSFVGTFKRSNVGFGTIVGSAVFNVLFVIGMCVMFTPEKYAPLELTWWPLFRDCSYYVVTLAFLAGFMFDGYIQTWEACIQLALYFGYVFMMSKSERLEQWFSSKFASKIEPATGTEKDGLDDAIEAGEVETSQKSGDNAKDDEQKNISLNKPSTFRVGILQLLTSAESLTATAGVAFVSKIKGDVNVVFDKIDANKNGEIDKEELKTCLQDLGTPEDQLTEEKIDEVMKQIDKNNNGHASKADFTLWYLGNEDRLKNKTKDIFNKYDTDGKGTISRDSVHAFMVELGHNSTDVKEAIHDAVSKIASTSSDANMLTYDDFTTWYYESLFWDQEKNAADAAVESQGSMFDSLMGGLSDLTDGEKSLRSKGIFLFTMPLTMLFCLIPDCRPPGKEHLAWYTLFGSIIMIAFFAIIMVELAEIFGASLGIPDVVMGLTILAAGTSVPDLLSSVIVAQQGHGDMAVSSSIGSNIFDVAFGLPLPWLTFNIAASAYKCECPVLVMGDPSGLFSSLITLLIMVGLIVLVIHWYDWKMTRQLGFAMFFFYFCYVGFALSPIQTPASDYTVTKCSPFDPLDTMEE